MIAIHGEFETSQKKKQSTGTKTPVPVVDPIRYSIFHIWQKRKFYFFRGRLFGRQCLLLGMSHRLLAFRQSEGFRSLGDLSSVSRTDTSGRPTTSYVPDDSLTRPSVSAMASRICVKISSFVMRRFL